MKRTMLVILCVAVLSVLTASAADWPQFRGLNRDAKSGDTKLLKSWPEGGPTLLWSKTGLGVGYTQAVVADGMVYVTGADEGTGYVSAFDLTGKPMWRKTYGPVFSGNRGRYPGSRSAPTVSNGRLYVAGSGGQLVCLDAKSGEKKWAIDFFKDYDVGQPQWGFVESVVVDGKNVILTTGGRTLMIALKSSDGSLVWKTEGIGDQPSYASPLIVERGGMRLIVTVTSASVVGVDAKTGVLVWKHPFRNGRRGNNAATTPVYADGRLFLSAGYGKGSEMLALSEDGKSVESKWTSKKPDNHHGNVVLVDGLVYGTGHKNTGMWVCIELATGKVMWEAKGVGKGSVSFADGLLYCYGEYGRVALVRPSPKGFEEISSFRVTEGTGEHWAHPTIAGGRLYIRHGDALMAYHVDAERITHKAE